MENRGGKASGEKLIMYLKVITELCEVNESMAELVKGLSKELAYVCSSYCPDETYETIMGKYNDKIKETEKRLSVVINNGR